MYSIFSDMAFGFASLFLGYQFYKMFHSHEAFKFGGLEILLITVSVLSGLFFIIYPILLTAEAALASEKVQFLRAFCIPSIGISAAFLLYVMIPKMMTLPKKSELEKINKALSSEIEVRTLAEKRLLNLNAELDYLVREKTYELQAVIDNSPLAIVKVDSEAHVLMWNIAAESLFGWKYSEIIGKQLPIMRQEQLSEFKENINKTTFVKKIFCGEVQRIHKNGSFLDLCSWNAPIKYGEKTNFALTMFADNSERKKLVDDLQNAKESALIANQSKSDFLARISHEIRTPLNAISGFSEILSSEEVAENDKRAYLGTIQKNSQFLGSLINDILDFSKIEAGKIKFESKEINLLETLQESVQTAQVNILNKSVQILLEPLPKDMPKFIKIDPLRFRQILLNMISNSIKFTPNGFVKIALTYQKTEFNKQQDESGILNIHVQDTGIGMTQEQVQQLFKPYYQADLNTSRKFGGTGLGLSIAKQLAKLMGGDIQLERTAPGQGCDFLISIKISAAAAFSDDLKRLPPSETFKKIFENCLLEGKKILVVDDSLDNLVLVSRIISKVGGCVETAEDGIQGVEKVSKGEYDVVLMDLEMPRMDGLEALHQIRSLGINTHIIALTGHAFEEDRTRCLEAGFDDYICKPIDKSALIQSVLKNLKPTKSNSASLHT